VAKAVQVAKAEDPAASEARVAKAVWRAPVESEAQEAQEAQGV
jgi:hypothetical protein